MKNITHDEVEHDEDERAEELPVIIPAGEEKGIAFARVSSCLHGLRELLVRRSPSRHRPRLRCCRSWRDVARPSSTSFVVSVCGAGEGVISAAISAAARCAEEGFRRFHKKGAWRLVNGVFLFVGLLGTWAVSGSSGPTVPWATIRFDFRLLSRRSRSAASMVPSPFC